MANVPGWPCVRWRRSYMHIIYVVGMEAYSDGQAETIVHRMCVCPALCHPPLVTILAAQVHVAWFICHIGTGASQ